MQYYDASEAFDDMETEWDVVSSEEWEVTTVLSLGMVSLDTLPQQENKHGFFRSGLLSADRWRPNDVTFSPVSTLRRAGMLWKQSVRNIRRRLPNVFQTVVAGLSTSLATRHPQFTPRFSSITTLECAACQTNVDLDSLFTPCGHRYHAECLLTLVDTSLQSLTAFPPRCCRQTIPTETFEHHMTSTQRARFAERQSEFDTPKRVYCANPRCSRFLGARDKRVPIRLYTCPSPACASARTCARCKAAVSSPPSPSHVCAHDASHRAALALGSRMGWVRCPGCEALVERHGGCAHMTCVCGAQFCYRCRARWKTCQCVDWGDGVGADEDEARLFAPLEDEGDLAERLTLWVPPTLSRAPSALGFGVGTTHSRGVSEDSTRTGTSSSRSGEGEASGSGSRVSDVWFARPRSQSCSFWRADDSRTRDSSVLVDGSRDSGVLIDSPGHTPPLTPTTLFKPLPPVPIASVHGSPVVDTTPLCPFPLVVDPAVLARGMRAQEERRRRRATSL